MQVMTNRYQQPVNEFVDKDLFNFVFYWYTTVSLGLFIWNCLAYNEGKNTLKTFVRFELLETS